MNSDEELDEKPREPIYTSKMLYYSLAGFLIGGIFFGVIGWAFGSGNWAIAGLGQYAASGGGVGGFVGAVTGGALGGFAGFLLSLWQLKTTV